MTGFYWIKPRMLLSILPSFVPPKNYQSHIERTLKWRKFVLQGYEREEKNREEMRRKQRRRGVEE